MISLYKDGEESKQELRMLQTYLNKAIMKMEPYETGENTRIRFGDISDNFTHKRMHLWTCVPVK